MPRVTRLAALGFLPGWMYWATGWVFGVSSPRHRAPPLPYDIRNWVRRRRLPGCCPWEDEYSRRQTLLFSGYPPDEPTPSWSQRETWKRKARRSMKYVSMPITSFPGQPREQLMVGLTFPALGKTVYFALDTLRRETIVTPATKDLLGLVATVDMEDMPHLPTLVELPAARIGKPNGDHFRVVLDALVASPEQVSMLGPNTGGVLGLSFLNRYDLDLNFTDREARFYVAGAVDQALVDTSGLEPLSCGYLPGGKMGIKMELNGGGVFTGVLDVKSNSSAGNWAAARDVDVTSMAKGQPSSYPRETGRTRPLFRAHFDKIQLGHVLLASVVDAPSTKEGRLAIYIGYLDEFRSLAEDISGKPCGGQSSRQLALVGLDLIGASRLVLSCKSKRLFFKPREENDVWAGQIV
ncbi:unnamed protein product [Discosporangium mesarthrocarpum]